MPAIVNLALICEVSTSALEASGAMVLAMTRVSWETSWNEMAASVTSTTVRATTVENARAASKGGGGRHGEGEGGKAKPAHALAYVE